MNTRCAAATIRPHVIRLRDSGAVSRHVWLPWVLSDIEYALTLNLQLDSVGRRWESELDSVGGRWLNIQRCLSIAQTTHSNPM